ncbi:hypothetical protein E2C01_003299 [Portunus trituberculatus]|uniref:Uncharacterized protein n=1 Tax=Portunus trituberculatus TaxID=210409 RepID=A0A5B7CNI4_PORTR|nr:hypothetical protein [Portunus trituberculatus]
MDTHTCCKDFRCVCVGLNASQKQVRQLTASALSMTLRFAAPFSPFFLCTCAQHRLGHCGAGRGGCGTGRGVRWPSVLLTSTLHQEAMKIQGGAKSHKPRLTDSLLSTLISYIFDQFRDMHLLAVKPCWSSPHSSWPWPSRSTASLARVNKSSAVCSSIVFHCVSVLLHLLSLLLVVVVVMLVVVLVSRGPGRGQRQASKG